MAVPLESGIGVVNFNKQSAKGTMATAASTAVGTNRPRLYESTLKPNKVTGSEEYVDGQRFSSPSQFVDMTGGEVGDVTIQAQAENASLFFAQILGVDVVTGASDPYTHTITSAGTAGGYGTWWADVGSSVRNREVFWDAKISKLVFEIGQDQKVAHQTMSLMSLKPGEVYTTNPTKTEDASDPFYWTEVTGAAEIDSTVVREVEGETLEIDTGMEVFYGDDREPLQLIEKKGGITRTLKTIVTDDTLAKYKKVLYGTATPTAGDRPSADVAYFPLETVYTKSATRTLSIVTPRVSVKSDDFQIGPQREGGKTEIMFGGECLKDGATPALTIVGLSADATSYA